jgi:hypothetical protein
MKFPYKIIKNVDKNLMDRWRLYYANPVGEWDRKIEEGLWRRTQDLKNKEDSGWNSVEDKRRRMIHYQHDFDLIKDPGNKVG